MAVVTKKQLKKKALALSSKSKFRDESFRKNEKQVCKILNESFENMQLLV